MQTPLLTEADPATSAEGPGDPIGLYAIADALAVRLVPGVRERQQHPRFLTVMAVSQAVCSEFGEDVIAKDGVSEPWQVFEWYVVEGLVRTLGETDEVRGLLGRDKAARALRDKVPLSAARYLKAPAIYGFHGAYRLLAETLRVEQDGRLAEFGHQLLTTWMDEQGLAGFHGTADGPGREIRRQLVAAVSEGLESGCTKRSGGWSGWSFFSEHLVPRRAGRREARTIAAALTGVEAPTRAELIQFLVSDSGQSLWRKLVDQNEDQRIPDERPFHAALRKAASPALGELLDAIDAYESFARLVQDAFDGCLHLMSLNKGCRTPLSELARAAGVERACREAPHLFHKAKDLLLTQEGFSARFQQAFVDMAEPLSAETWVGRLLERHRQVQRAKPPNGKNPWFERFDDGSVVIRPGYLRENGGRGGHSYVHTYRTQSLWSFANDLRMVS